VADITELRDFQAENENRGKMGTACAPNTLDGKKYIRKIPSGLKEIISNKKIMKNIREKQAVFLAPKNDFGRSAFRFSVFLYGIAARRDLFHIIFVAPNQLTEVQ